MDLKVILLATTAFIKNKFLKTIDESLDLGIIDSLKLQACSSIGIGNLWSLRAVRSEAI